MSANAVTLADIASVDWSLALDGNGGIGQVVQGLDDISQCLQIICTTQKGSDPLRPTFGADIFRFIDFPIQAAIPAIVRELTDAITLWEPRINLKSITATPVPSGTQAYAQLLIQMTWQLKINGTQGQTSVALPFGG